MRSRLPPTKVAGGLRGSARLGEIIDGEDGVEVSDLLVDYAPGAPARLDSQTGGPAAGDLCGPESRLFQPSQPMG